MSIHVIMPPGAERDRITGLLKDEGHDDVTSSPNIQQFDTLTEDNSDEVIVDNTIRLIMFDFGPESTMDKATLQQFRERPALRYATLLAVINRDLGERLEEALELGFDDVLLTPFPDQELRFRTRSLLWQFTNFSREYRHKNRGEATTAQFLEDAHDEGDNADRMTTGNLQELTNPEEFKAAFGHEWRRCMRHSWPVSLMMLQLDSFSDFAKLHSAKDARLALRRTARSVAKAVKRPGDLIVEWEPEIFAILLANTEASGARIVADRMQHSIRALSERLNSPVTFTASAGIYSIYPSKLYRTQGYEMRGQLTDAFDQVLKEARISLANARVDGANSVCVREFD